MSLKYDTYLKNHRACVQYAMMWLLDQIPIEKLNDIFPKLATNELMINIGGHDSSKNSSQEYEAYDDYFYAEKRTKEIEIAFDYAWLHHIHHNPHHWQYWILKEDDSEAFDKYMSVKVLDIPDNYILEMICDWWSFSWKEYLKSHNKIDLYEIFNWYEDHKEKMLLSDKTKTKVEDLLSIIRDVLDTNQRAIEIIPFTSF